MRFELARQLVVEEHPETDIEDITPALDCVCHHLKTHSISPSIYLSILRALIDKLAPRIASSPTSIRKKVLESVDLVFLHGNAEIAFGELCTALKLKNESSDIAARTLVLFVNEKLGGVGRLQTILRSADICDNVTNLVHLPSRVANAMHSESITEFDFASVIDEREYFGVVAEALYVQPNVADSLRDGALSQLIGRLVRMKQAEILVQRWLRKGITSQVVAVFRRAPQNALLPLIHALLDSNFRRRERRKLVNSVLAALVNENAAICELCISKLPFERPLLKRPRIALRRLVKAVADGDDVTRSVRALNVAAERWSAVDFSLGADIQLQRQVTRLLLYYLGKTSKLKVSALAAEEESVMLILVEGVHMRLSENDVRLRRHGMVVGEAASRHCNEEKLLTFSREGMLEARIEEKSHIGDEKFEDGGDSDFSDLALQVRDILSDNEASSSESSVPDENGDDAEALVPSDGLTLAQPKNPDDEVSVDVSSKRRAARTERFLKWKADSFWAGAELDDEDWPADEGNSLAFYEMTSSSEDENDEPSQGLFRNKRDYEAIRKKISAPLSIPRLLGLFREANKTSDGSLKVDVDTLRAALRTLCRQAEAAFAQRGTTLHACAVDLMLQVVSVDVDRYPDVYVAELRKYRTEALQRLLEMDFAECGLSLVEKVICGPTSDIGKRSECLSLLSAGMRGAQKRSKEVAIQKSEEAAKRAQEVADRKKVQVIGTVTRRMPVSLNRRKGPAAQIRRAKAWDDDGLAKVFDSLAERLCAGGGAEFLDLGGRDSRLWAQGLVALAIIGAAGGVDSQGLGMRAAVMEIVVERVLQSEECGDAVVRRGCALALGAIAEAMSEGEIEGSVVEGVQGEVVRRAGEWMKMAAQEDSDVGVRRFAGRSLRIWADRVERYS